MKTSNSFKLLLADDHLLLRDALANLINTFDEFSVILKAANGREVIEAIKNDAKPDILLMDLNMPEIDGYETARWVVKQHPCIKIAILTMYDTEVAMIRLLQLGVNGFIKKDIHPSELRKALLTVSAGEYYYNNDTTLKIASLFRKKTDGKLSVENLLLSETEIEFLKLAATELTYKEIAGAMGLTPRNIDNLRDAMFTKLEVQSRVGLAVYAVKNGIVTF